MTTTEPIWEDSRVIDWSQRLVQTYRHWLGQDLVPPAAMADAIAHQLFHAPFVVVSHDPQADPILNYGNQTALRLWEMDWATFTQTPSRLTAEPGHRDERSRMLAQLNHQGYVDHYAGIRISSSGQRFRIDNAIIWNLHDETGRRLGQAAMFRSWRFL